MVTFMPTNRLPQCTEWALLPAKTRSWMSRVVLFYFQTHDNPHMQYSQLVYTSNVSQANQE